MIYLELPYTDRSPAVQEHRYRTALKVVAAWIREGEAVHCPVVQAHPLIAGGVLPNSWSWWSQRSYGVLRRADRLVVLTLPGWERSARVQGAIREAKAAGVAVQYMGLGDWPCQEIC